MSSRPSPFDSLRSLRAGSASGGTSAPQSRATPRRIPTLLLLVLTLAACAPPDAPPADSPPAEAETAAEAPVSGGTLVVATSHDIAGVNDLVSSGTGLSEEVIAQLFLQLFEERPDFAEHPPTFAPRLAASWELSEDRLALTARLRDDVVWSDGVPVTAEDVAWTWRMQTDPEVGWAKAASKERIEAVEVVDPHTVRFRFTEAYAGQLADVNEGVVLPRHAWAELAPERWAESETWFQEHLVTDGPFRLAAWRPQEEIVLERNPDYYEAGYSEAGLPRLERVVFRVVPDRSAQVTELLRGEVGFVPRVGIEDVERIEAAAPRQARGVRLHPYWHRQYTYIGWNVERPWFGEAEVRRALTHALDRQGIIDTLYRGWARIATSPIISSVWAHADLEPWPHDPALAAEILERHGWVVGGDGVRRRGGERFAFTLLVNASSRTWRDLAAMVQAQLRRVGIEVELQMMEFNVLVARMESHDFDAVVGAFGIDTSLDLTSTFHSEGGYNFGQYADPRVDALIEEARSQLDPAAAEPALHEIQRILHRDQPVTFLWEPQRLAAMTTRLRDAEPNALSTWRGLRYWWLERPE